MTAARAADLMNRLGPDARPAVAVDSTDEQLLRSYAERRDEEAFAALVGRHGGLVWGVCRRALRSDVDAEDAFQATFLLLARRAGDIRRRGSVASWLFGAALRTAWKARRSASRRQARERIAAWPEPTGDARSDTALRELQ